MEFKWAICAACGPHVVCPACGNNCCNSGHGEVDGKPCTVCPQAYEVQSHGPPDGFKLTDEYVRWSRERAWELHEEWVRQNN